MSQVTGRRAGRAARALAGLAQHGRVDLEVAVGAEDDLVEVDLDAQQGVLPALAARARARRAPLPPPPKNVSKMSPKPEAAAPPPPPKPALRAEVVALALLGVAQHVVGVRDDLKRSAASALGLTSGCSSRASRRYAFLISSGVASRSTPRTS